MALSEAIRNLYYILQTPGLSTIFSRKERENRKKAAQGGRLSEKGKSILHLFGQKEGGKLQKAQIAVGNRDIAGD